MKTASDPKNMLTNWKWMTMGVVIMALLWSSCSLIGLFIGGLTKKKGTNNIAGWQTERIEKGDKVRMVLSNSDTLIGSFEGTELATLENYAILYNETKQKLATILYLPELGEEIMVSNGNNETNTVLKDARYYFEGFGFNTIYVRNKNNILHHLSLLNDRKFELANGATLNKGLIYEKLRDLEIPTRNFLLVKDGLGEVKMVSPMMLNGPIAVYKKGNYAMEGLGIGAIVDAALVIGVIITLNSLGDAWSDSVNNTDTKNQGSCPMVYSYDGKEYKMDSEPFGGSIYQKAQRTDVDKLEYLQADQGYYRFKLANELDETQFVDEFKLMVVDHPVKYTLVPAFNGEIQTFSNMTAPVSAKDQNGRDVLDKVKSTDQIFWVSYPFMRSPDVDGDERDGLILEFDKPAGAEEVKLAFNVQNTLWASSLQKELMSMQGSNVDAWYSNMNNTPEARTVFTNAMIREGMLLIKEWTGSEWETRDYVWEVGPAIPKDQAVVMKLITSDDKKLRIKLESTVGLWMINSVLADFEKLPTFSINELSPIEAVAQDGRNVLELLTKNDGIYYEMPLTTDWASIKFNAPAAPAKGVKRSYFLKCGGYYHIHVNNSIEPNQELIKELIVKPGAYGKFTLKNLNNKVLNAMQ